MAIEKFRFVSPGVQVNEIDDSILPPNPPAIGPVVIGNTAKGPAMQPVQVSSVAELERVFGAPSNGNVGAVDVWRTGVPTSPTLATYAAKAFLANSSPVTVMRLAGVETDSQSVAAKGGWSVDSVYQLYGVVNDNTGSLLANIYSNVTISLSGSNVSGTVGITGSTATLTIDTVDYKFSMDPNKKHFIRNVLNTNPTNIGSENYFLGETFENSTGSIIGYDRFFLQEVTNSAFTTFDSETGAVAAISPMVISELVSGTVDQYTDLFYFEGLNSGASLSKDIKISIENVKPSRNVAVTKYGTFDVVVRKLFESPTQGVLERFSGVTLDANSDNYIVKRIGDMKRSWDFVEKRYVEDGMYSNKSAYVRVVMAGNDISPFTLPAGFRMFQPPAVSVDSANNEDLFSGSVFYPEIELLDQVKLSSAKSKRFGLVSDSVENADLVDILCYKGIAGYLDPVNDNLDYRIFHTDFISSSATHLTYSQDVYCDQKLLTSGSFAGFDVPMYGGFDAKDITQKESFVNNDILGSGNELDNAAYRAIKQAIEMVAEPEFIDMNTLVIPGLQNEDLTNLMLEVCKTRGDAQAIIDLPGDYLYTYENSEPDFKITVLNVTALAQERVFDNSYGAAYFPAVFVPSEGIFMPASIAALGAIGGTEGRSALWFAPAGFNRGGLTEANSGISVSRTALHLTSADRDALYENNINPIATFPNEGVVIFGQKTLQATPSALDRVNVRRLVNYIKKQVSRAATRVLFEPNVENTWNSFKSVVEPFLLAIKNGYGLDDAKVVLDESTTTADLVDRNIMYCKIYLKPTRAIEYIAIDFVVTNSGAAFTE